MECIVSIPDTLKRRKKSRVSLPYAAIDVTEASIKYDNVFVFFRNYITFLKIGIKYIYILLYLFIAYTILLSLSYGIFISL
jgi:hypothetical protein